MSELSIPFSLTARPSAFTMWKPPGLTALPYTGKMDTILVFTAGIIFERYVPALNAGNGNKSHIFCT